MLSKELLGKYPKCKNCVTNHKAESCIAKGKPCYKCNKLGYFKRFYRFSGRGRGRFCERNFNNQNYKCEGKEYIEKFSKLHERYKKVFSGMGLLCD